MITKPTQQRIFSKVQVTKKINFNSAELSAINTYFSVNSRLDLITPKSRELYDQGQKIVNKLLNIQD